MDNRILIIDDEPTIRKLLARMLELEGYEIFQADDCTSGMKQLTLRRPQLVLCDVFLPDGNGVELVLNSATHIVRNKFKILSNNILPSILPCQKIHLT